MTQYMLSVIASADDYAADMTSDEVQATMQAVDVFNAELQETGAWVFAGGLTDIGSATVVDASGTDTVITDGPYAETKEFLGGFWVVEAADLDAALALATKGSAACKGTVEVRPFQSEPEA